jgi:5-methylcytosine-specific restriction endonuclease McrA
VTLNQPGPRGADPRGGSVRFAERLLEVIDSGRRTATYKLALLIALLDLCARHSDAHGRAPQLLYTRDIAEQVAGLYWPQVIPYLVPGADTAVELRQITLPRAAITAAVSAFRCEAVAAGATSWHLARQRLPGPYHAMLDQVEVTVAEQPLPRLQAVGSSDTVFPFLYELSWGPRESFSLARLRRDGSRGAAVRLLPGAGDELLRLGPLVRPLVELHWTRMVAEINQVATAELDLHRHLFGSDRIIPPKVLRDGIAALQDGRCFYCGGTLGAAPEADHFIPRIRCGIDAIENLVLADRRCNNDKRDLLSGPPHVTAWARRNQRHGPALTSLATASRWDTDRAATVAVARVNIQPPAPRRHPAVARIQRCRQRRPSCSPSRPGLKNRQAQRVRICVPKRFAA